MRWLRKQRGDTLVEVVLAIAILGSVLTIAYRMSTESFQLGVDSREHIQAVNVAQQQAEELRWYASQQMMKGTSLLSTANGTLLFQCPLANGICNMQSSAGVITPQNGAYDCSAVVSPGCRVQFQSPNDIALDPNPTAPPGSTYPELDEKITVTWPSIVQSSEPCLSAGANCETVSLDVRLADVNNYSPIDCSVAGDPDCTLPLPTGWCKSAWL